MGGLDTRVDRNFIHHKFGISPNGHTYSPSTKFSHSKAHRTHSLAEDFVRQLSNLCQLDCTKIYRTFYRNVLYGKTLGHIRWCAGSFLKYILFKIVHHTQSSLVVVH